MSDRLKYIVQGFSSVGSKDHYASGPVMFLPLSFSHLPYLMDLKLSHIVYNFPHYKPL
jgi:hypothetical protein